ncbi:hypothetical protein TBLA_0A02700 [Henningerozyma blattae CBS 6284]|uniref:NADPH:adrenodoxin oxidoreductase, mitochondrial n=1 Tax=Henningerozyma blattae (strain ATCC 34711 / CBS 6284 / DSM 70876 / NBRC 10599 / NRRL Y-10934 / UCD 77-7) TaxID=1071380 RepID=I2GVB7_HENB6|nr:hypothetical protein TBLA_0A02700 [Tetrapisispora blattae CBS 6284]CCH58069.1 hypothetical protein TBLA_0A02700 [Tetrapisispora blattae CBS 6284]
MMPNFLRSLSTTCNNRDIQRKTISIVGSGPSGFYTAYRLLSKSKIPIKVTLWEKLPVPFGLSRYGVAPDHPEVKNCEETFTSIANEYQKDNGLHDFQFIGNRTIGKDIPLKDLIEKQDAVILSYGCMGDKKLNIPGEKDTNGVFSSRQFVNWYNGHPEYSTSKVFSNFDWSRIKNVGIIGNGNVALDIARVLLSNNIGELWDKTDISPLAMKCLNQAPIKNVKIIARRDFVHSKFTNKELRELWELERYGIFGSISKKYFQLGNLNISNLSRPMKRTAEMCYEYLKPFNERTKKSYKKYQPLVNVGETQRKTWELDYLKTPTSIKRDSNGNITALELFENNITEDNRVIPMKDHVINYDMDLLITSLGYEAKPMDEFKELGIQFEHGHIANVEGRVQNQEGIIVPGLYTAGWVKHGSKGVIAATMMDAFNVADGILADLETFPSKPSVEQDISFLADNKVEKVSWSDWESLNNYELLQGTNQGKVRAKVLTVPEMLAHKHQKPSY